MEKHNKTMPNIVVSNVAVDNCKQSEEQVGFTCMYKFTLKGVMSVVPPLPSYDNWLVEQADVISSATTEILHQWCQGWDLQCISV